MHARAVIQLGAVTLVVDPNHWLDKHGHLPTDNVRLRRRILRIVQFIEAGALLERLHGRETVIPCQKRPKGKPCLGLMWVMKTAKDEILAFCMICKTDEAVIHHWQETEWADGPMEPVPMTDEPLASERLH